MPDTVQVECSGPGCTDTQSLGKRWAKPTARRFCSPACRDAYHGPPATVCTGCKRPILTGTKQNGRGKPVCREYPNCVA